jgi:lysozyme
MAGPIDLSVPPAIVAPSPGPWYAAAPVVPAVQEAFNLPSMIQQLVRHEGETFVPLPDPARGRVIGVGRNVDTHGFTQAEIQHLGGAGRDLYARPLSRAESRYLLVNDIQEGAADLDRRLPWWRQMNDARQRALLDMRFNLGQDGLEKFKKALPAMHAGDYETAAREIMDSDVGRGGKTKAPGLAARYATLAQMMRIGK